MGVGTVWQRHIHMSYVNDWLYKRHKIKTGSNGWNMLDIFSVNGGLQFEEFSTAKGGPLTRGFPLPPPTGEMGRDKEPQLTMGDHFFVYCCLLKTAVADVLFVFVFSLWVMKGNWGTDV